MRGWSEGVENKQIESKNNMRHVNKPHAKIINTDARTHMGPCCDEKPQYYIFEIKRPEPALPRSAPVMRLSANKAISLSGPPIFGALWVVAPP